MNQWCYSILILKKGVRKPMDYDQYLDQLIEEDYQRRYGDEGEE